MTKTALIVVAAALFDAAGRVLVQRRPSHKHHGGLWEFPGGKLELGETPEAALVRELDEELGVMVNPADLVPLTFGTDHGGERQLLLLLYRAERWRGAPEARDGQTLRWLAVDALAALDMPPADRPLVTALAGGMALPSGTDPV